MADRCDGRSEPARRRPQDPPPGYRKLTADLAAMGVDTDEDTVGRCLRGEIVTWELATPLSKLLDVPPPAHRRDDGRRAGYAVSRRDP